MVQKLNMTNEEICREYRLSNESKLQIRILAEMNLCAPDEIVRILKAGGEKVDARWYNRKVGKKKVSPVQKPPRSVHLTEDESALLVEYIDRTLNPAAAQGFFDPLRLHQLTGIYKRCAEVCGNGQTES